MSFLFKAEEYFIVWLDYILLICSSVDEHLGCFYLWAVMNNAAVDIRVRVFVQTCVFTSLGSIPGSGIAGPCGVCFTLWELPDSSPSLTCGVRGFPGSEAGGLGGLWSFLPDDLFQIQSWECRLEAGRWWETVALEGSDWVQCV